MTSKDKFINLWPILWLSLIFTTINGSSSSSEKSVAKSPEESFELPKVDKTKWIDPNDFQSRHLTADSETTDNKVADNKNELDAISLKLATCQQKMAQECECRNLNEMIATKENDQWDKVVPKQQNCAGDPTLLKHIVHRLLVHLNLDKEHNWKSANDLIIFEAILQLSVNDVKILRQLIEEERPHMNVIQDARRILETFIKKNHRKRFSNSEDIRPFSEKFWSSVYFFVKMANLIILIPASSILIQYFCRTSPRRLMTYFMLATFTVSVVWTWMHLYKEKQAERQMRFVTLDVPKECFPPEKSMGRELFDYIHSAWSFAPPNKCLRYYKDTMIDPLFEVTPLEAVAVAASKFLLRPLEILGENFAKFIEAFYSRLPITVAPVATGLLLIGVFGLTLITFGYSFRLAYGLVSIEPGIVNRAAIPVEPGIINRAAIPVEPGTINRAAISGTTREQSCPVLGSSAPKEVALGSGENALSTAAVDCLSRRGEIDEDKKTDSDDIKNYGNDPGNFCAKNFGALSCGYCSYCTRFGSD